MQMGDAEAEAEADVEAELELDEDHERDEDVCTVCARITCTAPLAVRFCSTSSCLRCVCWVPFGCEMFWESDIWNEQRQRINVNEAMRLYICIGLRGAG